MADTATMFGVALAASSNGKVLVRLDDEILTEFDEDEEGAVPVEFEDDLEGSIEEIPEDYDSDELGDYDTAGDVADDETNEEGGDSEGNMSDEATTDSNDELA